MFKVLRKAYEILIWLGGLLKSPLLLLIRLYWGWLFFSGGLSKILDIETFAKFLQKSHFVFPYFNAYLAASAECLGGLCLLVGFASRLAAVPLIITMLTAYATVHRDSLMTLFSKPSMFVSESPFNFLLASLIVLAFGPGRFSVDYLLERFVFKVKPSNKTSFIN